MTEKEYKELRKRCDGNPIRLHKELNNMSMGDRIDYKRLDAPRIKKEQEAELAAFKSWAKTEPTASEEINDPRDDIRGCTGCSPPHCPSCDYLYSIENTFTLDDLAEMQKKQMAINRKIKSRNDKIDIISLGDTVKDAVNKVINQKIASQKIKVHSERKKIIKQYKKCIKKV